MYCEFLDYHHIDVIFDNLDDLGDGGDHNDQDDLGDDQKVQERIRSTKPNCD